MSDNAESTGANPFGVECPKCHESVEIGPSDMGNDAACPACGLIYTIPDRQKPVGTIPADRKYEIPSIVSFDPASAKFYAQQFQTNAEHLYWIRFWVAVVAWIAVLNFLGGCIGFLAEAGFFDGML